MRFDSSSITSWRTACVAGVLALSLAACGDKDADEGATTTLPPAGTASGTTTASNIAVAEVRLGKAVDANRRVTDDTDDFDQNDTIYGSVLTSGAASNATLHARWTYEDGQLVDSTTQTIAPTADAATEFHISKPGGLPKGKYKLTVLLNGVEAKTKDFKVD